MGTLVNTINTAHTAILMYIGIQMTWSTSALGNNGLQEFKKLQNKNKNARRHAHHLTFEKIICVAALKTDLAYSVGRI
jgi:hypothetical protein